MEAERNEPEGADEDADEVAEDGVDMLTLKTEKELARRLALLRDRSKPGAAEDDDSFFVILGFAGRAYFKIRYPTMDKDPAAYALLDAAKYTASLRADVLSAKIAHAVWPSYIADMKLVLDEATERVDREFVMIDVQSLNAKLGLQTAFLATCKSDANADKKMSKDDLLPLSQAANIPTTWQGKLFGETKKTKIGRGSWCGRAIPYAEDAIKKTKAEIADAAATAKKAEHDKAREIHKACHRATETRVVQKWLELENDARAELFRPVAAAAAERLLEVAHLGGEACAASGIAAKNLVHAHDAKSRSRFGQANRASQRAADGSNDYPGYMQQRAEAGCYDGPDLLELCCGI